MTVIVSKLVAVATCGAISAGAIIGFVSICLARKVVMPSTPKSIQIYDKNLDSVSLVADDLTLQHGQYGLWINETGEHLLIGEIIFHDRCKRRVVRKIIKGGTSFKSSHLTGRWTGHVFAGPQELSANFSEVKIPVAKGAARAWLFPAKAVETKNIWAIHIHGIRTTRITALRTVPAAMNLGYTSLVPSFRGDGDAPSTLRGVSELGTSEWLDIDNAIGFAVSNGATSIILFGWSMGATIALLLSKRSKYTDLIKGMILISPATDWRAAISNGAQRAGLPQWLGRAAILAIGTSPMSKLVGLPNPIDFDEIDWANLNSVEVPTLVIHSEGDREIPISSSLKFKGRNPERVQLFESKASAHAWEYNTDTEAFEYAIASWAAQHIST